MVGPAFAQGVIQSQGSNPELLTYGDPYFRGYDNCYPDYWREYEWERELAQFEQNGQLPALSTVQLPWTTWAASARRTAYPTISAG